MSNPLTAALVLASFLHGLVLPLNAKAPQELGGGGTEARTDSAWRELQARFRILGGGAYKEFVASGSEAIPWLVEILEDSSSGTAQFMAANALGEIGARECVDPLLNALHQKWFNVRRCAALALGEIGDPRALPALERLAQTDPFLWINPDTKEELYLVRIDARQALEVLVGQVEIFLEDASKLPPMNFEMAAGKCRWPFPGGLREQRLYNNYQQPTDSYVHAGMDLLQGAGTEARAVEAGTVAAIATNYPDWDTHHFFIIEPEAGSGEGWCYTHLDPASFDFKVGNKISAGQVLGRVVDFSVGENDGVDHLHLHYVSFVVGPDGKVEFHSLYDPLLRFDWEDDQKPTIHTPFRIVRDGGLEPLDESGGTPRLTGKVDILVAISDCAYRGHVANWMTPVVTLEIAGEGVAPWRKLVLDQRGELKNARHTEALYLSGKERAPFVADFPRNPIAYILKVTNTDGDGVLERSDKRSAWDTAQCDEDGERRFPDGAYEIIVRAWDLAGNKAEERMRVWVEND